MTAIIDDTYAEAFRSLYTEFLVTAKNRKWLEHAVNAATGNASSTILCDCEAGVDRFVGPGGDETYETPDGRPGVIIQLHVPRFWKDRASKLERAALVRISQNILTCPTTSCFNLVESEDYFHMGRKVAYFGNGYQKRIERYGRKMWWIPTLGGEFVLDRRLGYRSGLMGGNLWFFGETEEAALDAAELAAAAVKSTPGVVLTFPGGVAASGSKAGSRYSFSIASTYEKYCPQLKDQVESGLPEGVNSVMEIIINGQDMSSIISATQNAIQASQSVERLTMISAGNYNGKLGKSFI
ncbi:MAG: formylmethanofuran--tetrahydromethanopterin N-formyltransferase, partial [Planctomycetota bacterium]|nr:formylmethanofuran--tetrahydromethanopterin N-formyltransferase [Planctomycetota bacterium]